MSLHSTYETLRHLADKLMEIAETDVSAMTGEEAHIRAI